MAEYFGVCIIAIDVQTLRADKYNEEAKVFVMLLYDGIHYDCFKAKTRRGVEATVFLNAPLDERTLNKVKYATVTVPSLRIT